MSTYLFWIGVWVLISSGKSLRVLSGSITDKISVIFVIIKQLSQISLRQQEIRSGVGKRDNWWKQNEDWWLILVWNVWNEMGTTRWELHRCHCCHHLWIWGRRIRSIGMSDKTGTYVTCYIPFSWKAVLKLNWNSNLRYNINAVAHEVAFAKRDYWTTNQLRED